MRGIMHQVCAGQSPKRHPDLVQRERRNRAFRGIVHQVRAGRAPKRRPNLVQRKRRNRVLREFVHQIHADRSPKRHPDLVQGKRRNGALRGIVHQVPAGRAPKRLSDLVQRKRRNRVLRGYVHQVRAGRSPKRLPDLVQRNGGTGFCGESCTKSAPPGLRHAKPPRAVRMQKITKSVKTPGASGSIPLLSGLAVSQYFLGFDELKSAGSSYFPELSISSWMS